MTRERSTPAPATYSTTLPDGPEARREGGPQLMPSVLTPEQERQRVRIDRLRRAWAIVERKGVRPLTRPSDGVHFRVVGNVEPYYDVDLSGSPPCYCLDMQHRERLIKGQCKHVLAARFLTMDESLLDILAGMLSATAGQYTRRGMVHTRGTPT